MKKYKVLNCYAGLGGNSKLWTNCEVVAVENEPKIAEIYQRLNPSHTVIVGDAHEYLLKNFESFDFIWSSPPCQTHSRMMKATRHKTKRYSDMSLYQEIILLEHFFKGKYVVENVKPFYEPLIKGQLLGRHMVWSNFKISDFDVKRPKGFITKSSLQGKKEMMKWLDIHYDETIYYGKNHCPVQILRNCVHPKLGLHIYNEMKKSVE